ncbi:MAG: hypothetical protein Q4D21_02620 [Phascolarctobacterium sp.]|nr:hypothetical protein [Phascolarctobacterium sp.]
MTSKYIYNGMDITLDVYEKLRAVIELIASKEKISFDEAYASFAKTRTYWCVQNPQTVMWSESAEFIVDEYYREKGFDV